MSFTTKWVDLEIIILGKVSQTEKDKYHMISFICKILKKMIQMNLFTKQKQTHRLREQTYGYRGEGRGAGIDWEFENDTYTLLYLKQINSKDLLYSTGNSAQYSTIS